MFPRLGAQWKKTPGQEMTGLCQKVQSSIFAGRLKNSSYEEANKPSRLSQAASPDYAVAALSGGRHGQHREAVRSSGIGSFPPDSSLAGNRPAGHLSTNNQSGDYP
jgi:hypothetical protein